MTSEEHEEYHRHLDAKLERVRMQLVMVLEGLAAIEQGLDAIGVPRPRVKLTAVPPPEDPESPL